MLKPKNPRGGSRGLTDAQLIEALQKNGGNILAAANALGVTDSAIYQRLANHPQLAAIQAEMKSKVTEMAKARILKRIERDDWNAINLWLTTQAGWTKQTAIANPDGSPLSLAPAVNITVNYVTGTPEPKTEGEVL